MKNRRFGLSLYWGCVFAAILGVSQITTQGYGEEREESYIAVVAAYDGELKAIREVIEWEEILEERSINGVKFSIGTAYGKRVIFFLTGISVVNAAMTTQLTLSEFEIRALLFSGIAGGVNPELKKGDVAIPAEWHYELEGAYYNEKSGDPGVYQVPPETRARLKFGNFGMFHPESVRVIREGETENEEKVYFGADPTLLKVARRAGEKLELANATGNQARIKFGGRGATGPLFMDNTEFRKFIYDTWQSDSVDMESTAIAHVCWANRVPFLIVRSMSDLAGGEPGEDLKQEFVVMAQKNAARILNEILKEMK